MTTIAVSTARQKSAGELRRAEQILSGGGTIAWARHITGQDVNDPNSHDYFRSVAVVPGSAAKPSGAANREDNVYVCVQRDINNVTVKTIEMFTPVDWGDDPNYCWFVDCASGDRTTRYQPGSPASGVPGVPGEYPTLRATTDQADPGLTKTTPISNVTELQAMSSNLAGNYYLTGDIDASATSTWNGGQGFIPIGGAGPGPFTGTFDGCGYTITGLVCNRPSTSYQGLFGYVANPAIIANVTLASCTITGRTYVGALAGYVREYTGSDVKVQNCHSSGTVQGTTDPVSQFVGGLIGDVASSSTGTAYIYDCSSSCTVTTAATVVSEALGGLIGLIDSATVSNCFATGNVTGGTIGTGIGGMIGELGTSIVGSVITYSYATGAVSGNNEVGGFVGISSQNDVIQKCYATGNVTIAGAGATDGGGFVGRNSNTDYTDCYAWGDVTCAVANGRVGGFCGADLTVGSGALFTNCYSIGSATGLLNPGGFIELTSGTPVITNSYWDTEASGNAISDGGEGKTTAWIKLPTNFPVTWDYETIWYNPYTEDTVIPAVPAAWLTHDGTQLDGEQVCVYADAIPRGSFAMDGNDILGFTEASYSVVIAGLNYYSIYETFPLSGFTPLGSSRNQKCQIYNVRMDFYETLGCNLGTSLDDYAELIFSDDDFATQIDPWTGPKVATFPRGESREPVLYLWIWEPVPCTIRALYPTMNVDFGGP